MQHYSLEPFKYFLEQILRKDEYYSIPGLRLRAQNFGITGNDLTRLTEALIWQRYFHDFPKEGDGIELVDWKIVVAWRGARWKSLFVQPAQNQATSFLGRLLRGAA